MTLRNLAFAFIALTVVDLAGPLSPAHADPYLRPDQVPLTRLIAPAPAPDSAVTQGDIALLLNLQAARTPEMVALANADVERKLSRFSDVMGTDLSPEKAPLANAFVDKAWDGARPIIDAAKDQWKRVRPFIADPSIKLAVPEEKTFSYPSGHAAYGAIVAILLANMVPEKAQPIYDRGAIFGISRLIGGIHYPSDVEASQKAAPAIVAQMMQNPDFQADLVKATAEVRALLSLPALADTAKANAPVPATAK